MLYNNNINMDLTNNLNILQHNLDNYIQYCNILQEEYKTKHNELLALNDIIEEKNNENNRLKSFLNNINTKTKSKKNINSNKKYLKKKIKTQKRIKRVVNKKIQNIKKKLGK